MKLKLKTNTGQSRKKYKEWWDETKQYRITWCKERFGIIVPPHFHACVKIMLPCGRKMIDFVGKRGSYKTFKLAIAAAEKHQEQWLKASEATGIRQIEEIFGKVPLGIPIGAKLKRNIRELITQKYLL
jgi:hypothetical protein